ncbi:MAG: transcription antitermination factor NusB [Synergistales bacterium]|nr:transcription antitermination factor NusB [Synergistales bacterium]
MKKNLLPQKRRRSREIALQILYSLDIRHDQGVEDALQLFPTEGEDEMVIRYASVLVQGVWSNRQEIDDLIRSNLVGWKPERMVAVDRASLRLALYEGVIARMIPIAVSISEAVELAKTFGTPDSGKFVNGVLGKIVRSLPSGENSD